jgi:hypothetical protein
MLVQTVNQPVIIHLNAGYADSLLIASAGAISRHYQAMACLSIISVLNDGREIHSGWLLNRIEIIKQFVL